MPSGLENLDGNRFILRYEQPWGGIASNAAPEDIAPNQLVNCDGLFIKNGRLCSANFYSFDPNQYIHQTNTGQAIQLAAIYKTTRTRNPSQNVKITESILVGVDIFCNGYIYDITVRSWSLDKPAQSWQDPNNNTIVPNYSCSLMVRGIVYIFDWNAGAQYVYNPAQYWTIGTKFVGGKFCMSLAEQLVVCNTNMQNWMPGTYDGKGNSVNPPYWPPTAQDGKPPYEVNANRVNWSAAQEAYTTWNNNQWNYPPVPPATVGPPFLDPTNQLPADRSAGWNGLADVQQEITGCFAMGNVGYILHDSGVTQMTPTASAILGETAIQPFDFTLLWGGKDGMGCTMPYSLSVYGHLAIWGNNNGIYLFTGSAAPQDITGISKAAIYTDINMFHYNDNRILNVYGVIYNMGVDSKAPELAYDLFIVYQQPYGSGTQYMAVWSYVFSTQTWTRQFINLDAVFQQITNNPSFLSSIGSIYPATLRFPGFYTRYTYDNGFYSSPFYGGLIFNLQNNQAVISAFWLFHFMNDGIPSLPDHPPITNLQFRTEEFQIYRQPTIRGFIIRAAGSGTLHISVNGYNFLPITLNGDVTKTTLYRSFGMWTGMAPAVNITSTDFNGYITKVHAFGTYAEGEPI